MRRVRKGRINLLSLASSNTGDDTSTETNKRAGTITRRRDAQSQVSQCLLPSQASARACLIFVYRCVSSTCVLCCIYIVWLRVWLALSRWQLQCRLTGDPSSLSSRSWPFVGVDSALTRFQRAQSGASSRLAVGCWLLPLRLVPLAVASGKLVFCHLHQLPRFTFPRHVYSANIHSYTSSPFLAHYSSSPVATAADETTTQLMTLSLASSSWPLWLTDSLAHWLTATSQLPRLSLANTWGHSPRRRWPLTKCNFIFYSKDPEKKSRALLQLFKCLSPSLLQLACYF